MKGKRLPATLETSLIPLHWDTRKEGQELKITDTRIICSITAILGKRCEPGTLYLDFWILMIRSQKLTHLVTWGTGKL